MHIFIKVGGRLRGERLNYSSMYLLYIIFLSFSHKFSRSLRLLDCVLSSTKNTSMQCALPTPFIYIFFIFGFIIHDCKLPNFTESKRKIAYKMSKNCLPEWGDGKRGE